MKQIQAEVEAELDARFKEVKPLEKLMEDIARRESALAERERQCTFLLEELSEKTAELVLAKGLFAERADGTLRAMINEFASLCRAIDEKVIVPVPSGKVDDAKKGEGKKNEGNENKGEGKKDVKEGEEEKEEKANGKDLIVYQEKAKQQKLLASSTSDAAAHKARTSSAVIQQIEFDAALATTLEKMKSIELIKTGVTEIPFVQPLQTVPTQAAPAAPSKVPALTAPPAVAKKKPAPAKTQPKRPAPADKEADSAAKHQKIQATLTAKASRLAEKRKEEEEKKKEVERKEAFKLARMKKVKERATKLWDENRLIQSCSMKSGCIPFTPDES